MNNWGVSKSGFNRPSYDEILKQIKEDMKTVFGKKTDLSSYTPLGQLAQVLARHNMMHWTAHEETYDAGYIDSASDENLDKLAAITGIRRNPATYATGEVIFSRNTPAPQTYTIPEGTTVATEDRGITFVTTRSAAISKSETSSDLVPVRATSSGIISNQEPETVSVITTPVFGVDTVINQTVISGGSDRESDAVFRSRIKNFETISRGTMGALESALKNLDGVIGLNLVEDMNTNSVRVIILGGNADIISETIESTRPAGILVTWSRPVSAPINIAVSVTGDTERVSDALSAYIIDNPVGRHIGYSELVACITNAGSIVQSLTATYQNQTATKLGDTLIIPEDVRTVPGTISIIEV